jgi:translation initiation factor 5A
LSHACIVQVPHVNRVEYQLIDISEDGFVRLLPFQPLPFCLSIQLCLFGNTFWFITIDEGILQVSLLTENGSTKDDTRLPSDEGLQAQVS